MQVLGDRLPPLLLNKLKKLALSHKYRISWEVFENQLKKLNLSQCRQELVTCLQNNTEVQKQQVKLFHIHKNDEPLKCTEPTLENTTTMVFRFLKHIYERNILASVVKYIILTPLLRFLENPELVPEKKGIFFMMHQRLKELVFECVLTAFNGSNYDNYLIINSLIIIQSLRKEKIYIFKKGTSISSVLLINKINFGQRPHRPKKTGVWPMRLYIKDVRNLVSATMSLDKLAQRFNLPLSKLVFPYERAVSVTVLKSTTSLHPENDLFWRDSFFQKTPSIEARREAQNIFTTHSFKDLYEYSCYYLVQDCMLLHSIVLTLFNSFNPCNIFIRRNYSQSSLAYQTLQIVEPSRQIKNLLAPLDIRNTFYNHFIKQGVTGGLCTSFVHGNINNSTIINEHFKFIQPFTVDPQAWPSFSSVDPFDQNPSGIRTVDIRSLYPSAAVKHLPVGAPYFYSRFTKQDAERLFEQSTTIYKTLNIQTYCQHAQTGTDPSSDQFRLLSKPPPGSSEYYALADYLKKNIPKNVIILRFQSNFTAFGQMIFVKYPVDGYLCFQHPETKQFFIKIIQYHSTFRHGHCASCPQSADNDPLLVQRTESVTQDLNRLADLYKKSVFDVFNIQLNIEVVELFECNYKNHHVPKTMDFGLNYRYTFNASSFLEAIYAKKLTGLLVVKNLNLQKKNPIFGFIIQKIEYGLKNLSPYTAEQVTRCRTSKRVVGVNKAHNFMVISSEYLLWLKNTFGFEKDPEIYHALFFKTAPYLKASLEAKLEIRKNLKELIKNEQDPVQKQNLEVKAELLKLMLNSCYGYTLCNLSGLKFKSFQNRRTLPKAEKSVTCYQFAKNIYLVQTPRVGLTAEFQTLLGHVGAYILFNSKIILLKRLYFLLKYLNPRYAQLAYMDTDSAHFIIKHKTFEENVDDHLRQEFLSLYNKHFETGSKLSGIWVEEGFFTNAEYLAEKCYRLYNNNDNVYLTHMKGLNQHFQQEYHLKNINPKETPYLSYNLFFKSPDFVIFKQHIKKKMFLDFVPNKRYFVSAAASFPLKF